MDQHTLLRTTLELIRHHPATMTPEGLKAAQVGMLLRKAHPDLHWGAYGYIKLGDVLCDLESQGLIRTGLDSKRALSVWLPSVDHVTMAPVAAVSGLPPRPQPFRPLRKEAWAAFVMARPGDRSFISRLDGTVRIRVTEPPTPPEHWAEVAPIGQETQQQWVRQFLAEHHPAASPETIAAATAPDWFRAFPAVLAKEKPVLLAAWNRLRSRNVQEHVLRWCAEHHIAENLVFDTFPTRQPYLPAVSQAPVSLRESLLNAISRMETEDLLEVRIPAKHLVSALRPDLLRPSSTGRLNG